MKKRLISIAIIVVSLFFWKEILLFILTVSGYSSLYTREGILLLQQGNKTIKASIYRSKNVPYTLIGPIPFPEQEDFLFVGKNKVAGRILDEKVEDDYYRFCKWLFIMFDLSSKPDAMAPAFFFETKIRYDEKQGKYFYEITPEGSRETESKILFSLDKKFLSNLSE